MQNVMQNTMNESSESIVRRRMHERWVSKNTSSIIVTAINIDIGDYKIYIDGNIHGTSLHDKRPDNGHYIRIEPGSYCRIIRENDTSKVNRQESNAINFKINEHETMCFTLEINDELLVLRKNNTNTYIMNKWIKESAKLLGQWDKVAAEKALIYLSQDREKSADEMLMGYAIAERLFSYAFTRYAGQKDTLSTDEEEILDLSIELARKSIPEGRPLLYIFLKEASFIKVELAAEVDSLKMEIMN